MNPTDGLKKLAYQLKTGLYGKTVKPIDDSKIGELIQAVDSAYIDWDPDDPKFKTFVQKIYGRDLKNEALIAELKSNEVQNPDLLKDLIQRTKGIPAPSGVGPQVTSKVAQHYLETYDFEFEEVTEAEPSVGIMQSYDSWVGPKDTDYVVVVFEDGSWELRDDEKDKDVADGRNSTVLKWVLKDLFPAKV